MAEGDKVTLSPSHLRLKVEHSMTVIALVWRKRQHRKLDGKIRFGQLVTKRNQATIREEFQERKSLQILGEEWTFHHQSAQAVT